MSGAGPALRSAAIEALEALELGGVYPGPPLQAFPHAIVETGPESDWGHKSGRGRELRLAVTVRDLGERPDRAQALADVVEAAIGAGLEVEGWRPATLALVRRRRPRRPRRPHRLGGDGGISRADAGGVIPPPASWGRNFHRAYFGAGTLALKVSTAFSWM